MIATITINRTDDASIGKEKGGRGGRGVRSSTCCCSGTGYQVEVPGTAVPCNTRGYGNTHASIDTVVVMLIYSNTLYY